MAILFIHQLTHNDGHVVAGKNTYNRWTRNDDDDDDETPPFGGIWGGLSS